MKKNWLVLFGCMILTTIGFQNCAQHAYSDSSASSSSSPDELAGEGGLSKGTHAFFGIWEYGNSLGNDPLMCASTTGGNPYSDPGTGCIKPATRCPSGQAVAAAVYKTNQHDHFTTMDLPAVPAKVVEAVAREFGVSSSFVKAQSVLIWDYVCVE